MKSLDQLDRWIAGKIKGWAARTSGAPPHHAMLEIRRDILEDVRDRIEPKGSGRSVFPFHGMAVAIAAADEADADRYTAAFSGNEGLEADIRELLGEARAAVPQGFGVDVTVTVDAEGAQSGRPFAVTYSRQRPAPAAAVAKAAVQPTARLTVVRGDAAEQECDIAGERVNIGRLKEVVGDRDGLRRRNDLAFQDSETTVSREHAHIRYQAGTFRLYDTNSARGTAVFRDGRRLEVPRGAARGLTLRSGDEIHLGEARVRFEILA
jgi:FHA domain